MIGLSGDYLIYKGADYQAFMQNYLGATLNFWIRILWVRFI